MTETELMCELEDRLHREGRVNRRLLRVPGPMETVGKDLRDILDGDGYVRMPEWPGPLSQVGDQRDQR